MHISLGTISTIVISKYGKARKEDSIPLMDGEGFSKPVKCSMFAIIMEYHCIHFCQDYNNTFPFFFVILWFTYMKHYVNLVCEPDTSIEINCNFIYQIVLLLLCCIQIGGCNLKIIFISSFCLKCLKLLAIWTNLSGSVRISGSSLTLDLIAHIFCLWMISVMDQTINQI